MINAVDESIGKAVAQLKLSGLCVRAVAVSRAGTHTANSNSLACACGRAVAVARAGTHTANTLPAHLPRWYKPCVLAPSPLRNRATVGGARIDCIPIGGTTTRSSSSPRTTGGRTHHEPFNFNPMVVNPISSGSPHVRPMGVHRTCGEPDELKRNTHPENCPALLRARHDHANNWPWRGGKGSDFEGGVYASQAVQCHPHGGQFDFVWLSARTMHPHGGPQHVWCLTA